MTTTTRTNHPSHWTTQALWDYVAGLSKPSKMPGYGYSIPAARCKIGAKLRKVAGSTCSACYALKGRYVFPNVAECLERRYQTLDAPEWVDAMSELIRRKCVNGHPRCRVRRAVPYFRWHDAGDLQSVDHLARIVLVCRKTPGVTHWLPTREYQTVRDFIAAGGTFPPNLTVRLSAHMIGGHAPTFPDLQAHGVTVSTVDSTAADAFACLAPSQKGECRDCRACWNPAVSHVTYKKH